MRRAISIATFSFVVAFLFISILNTSCTSQQDQTKINRAGQTLTVINIQKLGQTIEMYIMDHDQIGAPKASDIEALAKALNYMDWNEKELVVSDGWGNNFIYEADMTPGSKKYRLISYGADAQPGPETATPGLVKQFTEDIIYENGTFKQRPEGAQR